MASFRKAAQLPLRLDPRDLRDLLPGFAHFFPYPLHRRDFHPLRAGDDAKARLLGYYAAKPLYAELDAQGRVDRDSGFNGDIIAVFLPSPARSWRRARLIRAHMPRDLVRRTDGKRNWPRIRQATEVTIRDHVLESAA